MKIEKRSMSSSLLREGDSITVAVTHEIRINGDSSWVRYEATSKVQNESADDATRRVITQVNLGVMEAVTEAVNGVQKAINQ